MNKRIKKIDVQSTAFTPSDPLGTIDIDHSVCVRLTNFDDFMLWFSTDRFKREDYFSPYKMLSKLEEKVIEEYMKRESVENVVSINYKKYDFLPDAMFEFVGFSYDVESKTLIIDYSFWTTVG